MCKASKGLLFGAQRCIATDNHIYEYSWRPEVTNFSYCVFKCHQRSKPFGWVLCKCFGTHPFDEKWWNLSRWLQYNVHECNLWGFLKVHFGRPCLVRVFFLPAFVHCFVHPMGSLSFLPLIEKYFFKPCSLSLWNKSTGTLEIFWIANGTL